MAVVWNVVALDANVETGAINTAHWEASDYEVVEEEVIDAPTRITTHRGRRYGSVTLEANVDAEGFIAWSDVTKENAIAWVKEALGDEVAETEAYIASEIAESKAPTVTHTNPWEMGDNF
jgi:hypothetical protein